MMVPQQNTALKAQLHSTEPQCLIIFYIHSESTIPKHHLFCFSALAYLFVFDFSKVCITFPIPATRRTVYFGRLKDVQFSLHWTMISFTLLSSLGIVCTERFKVSDSNTGWCLWWYSFRFACVNAVWNVHSSQEHYLPGGPKGSSTSLNRLELGRVLIRFVILEWEQFLQFIQHKAHYIELTIKLW